MLEWFADCLIYGYRDKDNNTISYERIIEKIKSKYKDSDKAIDKFNNILIARGYSNLIKK